MKKKYGIMKNGAAAIFLMGLCLAACGKAQEPEETVEVVEEVQEPEIETEEPEVKPYSKRDLLFISDYQGANEKLWLDGRFITEAKVITGSDTNGDTHYYVGITLDDKGTDLLKYATTELSKDNSILYIVLGDEVISDPVVTQPIVSGDAILSATSLDEAEELQKTLSREDEEE